MRVAGLFHELVFGAFASYYFSIGVALYCAVGAAAVVVRLGCAAAVIGFAVCTGAVGALAGVAVHIGAVFTVVPGHIGLCYATNA